jgi:hypothetical protein
MSDLKHTVAQLLMRAGYSVVLADAGDCQFGVRALAEMPKLELWEPPPLPAEWVKPHRHKGAHKQNARKARKGRK